jgi:YHS domain-containing protein
MRTLTYIFLVFTCLNSMVLCFESKAQSSTKIKADTLKYCLTPQTVGIGAYDPISYFEQSAPLKGKKEIFSTYDGVTYWFVNSSNKKKFDANPSAYLPQFGGWCSMTLAMGRATVPKYDNFLVSNGKLYLFERTLSVNGKELWIKDVEGNEKIALKNYLEYKNSGKIN